MEAEERRSSRPHIPNLDADKVGLGCIERQDLKRALLDAGDRVSRLALIREQDELNKQQRSNVFGPFSPHNAHIAGVVIDILGASSKSGWYRGSAVKSLVSLTLFLPL